MLTLIRGGLALIGRGKFEWSSILIEDGRIISFQEPTSLPPDCEVIDASSMLVIPGLVNGHTHSYANLSRGLGGNLPLEFFALEGAWAAANRTRDEHYLSAMLGCIEMLKHGVTTVLDQPGQDPLAAAASARAYVDAGMRAVVAPMVWDRPYHHWLPWKLETQAPELWKRAEARGRPSTAEMIDVAADFAATWYEPSGRVRAGVGPFAPGRCSDDLLEACAAIAAHHDLPLHTHLLETRLQASGAQEDYGESMVQHLDSLGFVTSRFSGAHGVWLSDPEITILARHQASVVHNPVSNMTLGSGVAPLAALRAAGVNVGLGSDGSNCGGNQSIFAAMKASVLLPRISGIHYSAWPSAADAIEMATANGARVMGDDSLGKIAVGARADLALVSRDTSYLTPLNDPSEQLVHAESGGGVRTVLVDGRVVVRDGRLTHVDEWTFLSEARDAMRAVADRNVEARGYAREVSSHLASVWDDLQS